MKKDKKYDEKDSPSVKNMKFLQKMDFTKGPFEKVFKSNNQKYDK